MDVRTFISAPDAVLEHIIQREKLACNTYDDSALAVQRYVVKNLIYTSDDKIGRSEYWLFPFETLAMGRGDCEDGAILITSLLHNILPPQEHWRLRVAAGWVQIAPTAPQGGHAYCTYCRTTDNEWVALDWCYCEDSEVTVREKPTIKNVAFYKDLWFSFNRQCAWSHVNFAMQGRINGARL
jgi:formylglycine-generating enzyme required for sulfatase activity